MFQVTQKKLQPPQYKQSYPTTTFLKLYKQDLHHLLETDDNPELYEAAKPEVGAKFVRETYVRDNNGNQFRLLCSIQDFKKYGVGIYLFFLFLRSLVWLYIVKSFLAIGVMVIMSKQVVLNPAIPGNSFFISISLGNVMPNSAMTIIWAIDTSSTILFLLFIIFWNEYQQKVVIACAQIAPLPSYYTVMIKDLPLDFNEQNDLKQIIRKFGPIQQVYTVRDYVDYLFYYQILINTLDKIKIQKAKLELNKTKENTKYYKLLQEFYIIYVKIKKMQDEKSSKPVFIFISFRTIFGRETAVKHLASDSWFCNTRTNSSEFNPKNLTIERCHVEPSGILWENIHLGGCQSFKKFIVQLFLLFIVLIGGIAIVALCTLFQSAVNIESSDQDDCMTLGIVDFMKNQKCKQLRKNYFLKLLLSLTIPVVIMIIKQLMTRIIDGLAYFRRFGTVVELIKSQFLTYWIVYFVTTTWIIPLIHVQIGSFSFEKLLRPVFISMWPNMLTYKSIPIYNEFNFSWYRGPGNSIILTGVITFALGYLGQLLINWLLAKLARWQAKKQKIQKLMNKKLKGSKLFIALIYAQALTLICFVEFYSVGLPILTLSAAFSLLILYFCVKINFIRFCRTPPIYNQSINQIGIKIMLIGFIIHNFISPLILCGVDSDAPSGFIRRTWKYGSYIILTGIALLYYLGRQIIAKACRIIYRKINHVHSRSSMLPHQINNIDRTFKEALKVNTNELTSYRMDENPKYKYLLKALYTLCGANAIMTAYNNDFWMYSDSDETIKNNSSAYPASITLQPFFGLPSKREVTIAIDQVQSHIESEILP